MLDKIRNRLGKRVTKRMIFEELLSLREELAVLRSKGPAAGTKDGAPTEAQAKSEWFGEDD